MPATVSIKQETRKKFYKALALLALASTILGYAFFKLVEFLQTNIYDGEVPYIVALLLMAFGILAAAILFRYTIEKPYRDLQSQKKKNKSDSM